MPRPNQNRTPSYLLKLLREKAVESGRSLRSVVKGTSMTHVNLQRWLTGTEPGAIRQLEEAFDALGFTVRVEPKGALEAPTPEPDASKPR
jgi:hypothetical protein